MHTTLSALLAAFRPAGAPGAEIRARRARLADFVRAFEDRVHRAPGGEREALRRLLGWDDESLHRFINSPMVVHSSTHIAMNAFAPMLSFPWFCLRLTTGGVPGPGQPGATHLRTQLTHNNLSDNRWKPHVWWHADDKGRLVRTQLFSKQPRFKHQVLLAQRVPEIPAEGLAPGDARALRLARHATNFAYFAMIYRLCLERESGFHLPGGTVEIPLDMMNAHSLNGSSLTRWRTAMYDNGLAFRRIGPAGELHELGRAEAMTLRPADPLDARSTIICPNYLNLWHSYRLGLTATIGTERMANYEATMADELAGFFDGIGEHERFPQFLGVSAIDLEPLAPLPAALSQELREGGGRPSLPLYIALYGDRLLPALDQALGKSPEAFAQIVTRRLAEPVPH